MTRAEELATAHWEYVGQVLKPLVTEQELEVISFHYRSEFEHGYKHAEEDILKGGENESQRWGRLQLERALAEGCSSKP
jgi:hypothetical protein